MINVLIIINLKLIHIILKIFINNDKWEYFFKKKLY
jgi:hypothetical protein